VPEAPGQSVREGGVKRARIRHRPRHGGPRQFVGFGEYREQGRLAFAQAGDDRWGRLLEAECR
jgi:hypothetical protein